MNDIVKAIERRHGRVDLIPDDGLTLITRAGEVKMMAIRKPLVTASEDRLIEQLANINATLLRASKKHTAVYTGRR